MLEEASAHVDAKTWPSPVFRFLRGELKEEGLLAAADDNDRMTEARAYLWMSHALAGRPDAARPHLEWVVKNGNREFVEYTLAGTELRRLKEGP